MKHITIGVEQMMKQFLLLACLVSTSFAYANEAKNEWNGTKLSDDTIKKIQQSQYQYKKCVISEMQKLKGSKIVVKETTANIIKQCEPVLAQMRQVYLEVKVPAIVADRHLKKMRFDITRRVLKQLMFAAAANKARQ